MVHFFEDLFSYPNLTSPDPGLINSCIPKMVNDEMNIMLIKILIIIDINSYVFSLNNDGAPGHDGFDVSFYQQYWDMISHDVSVADIQFFQSSWILPSFNSNILILIPKSSNVDYVDHFRPIAITKFNFKTISKVLADRLDILMPTVISSEKKFFVQGRNIRDCIGLTSESINLPHKKAHGHNIALKVDITKAFNSLN